MKKLFLLLIIISFVFSCTQDTYEKGDGEYSLLRGEFVEAQADANKQLVTMVTDDGDRLAFSKPYSAKWIMKGDTTYRCMLYYNKVEKSQGEYEAEVISLGQVPCPIVKSLSEFDKEFRTDPVKFESMWLSKSGKYLNFYLQFYVILLVRSCFHLIYKIISHHPSTRYMIFSDFDMIHKLDSID